MPVTPWNQLDLSPGHTLGHPGTQEGSGAEDWAAEPASSLGPAGSFHVSEKPTPRLLVRLPCRGCFHSEAIVRENGGWWGGADIVHINSLSCKINAPPSKNRRKEAKAEFTQQIRSRLPFYRENMSPGLLRPHWLERTSRLVGMVLLTAGFSQFWKLSGLLP